MARPDSTITRVPYSRSTFEYFGGKTGHNPAIADLLKGPMMFALINRLTLQARSMYARRVDRGKRKNPQRNFRSTRISTRLESTVGPTGHFIGIPDRWTGELDAFARHALAREFGHVLRTKDGAKRVSSKSSKLSPVAPVHIRSKAESVLGGYRRKRDAIVKDLENGIS